MIDYMDKLDPELDLMEHYICIIMAELEDIITLYELLEKEDIRRRKGYPYYHKEFPDKEKRKIISFQRHPELYIHKF